jgi:hypothetical protein
MKVCSVKTRPLRNICTSRDAKEDFLGHCPIKSVPILDRLVLQISCFVILHMMHRLRSGTKIATCTVGGKRTKFLTLMYFCSTYIQSFSDVRVRVRISDFNLSPSPTKWPGPKSSAYITTGIRIY